jgi:hypothetical protein
MRLLVIYRPNSEHSRGVESFVRDFKYQHTVSPGLLDVMDVDTREGSAMASLYDILQYPAVLALTDDGQVVKSWEGSSMPLMNEVAGYVYGG